MRGQPLLRKTPLKKWHACRHVGQPVHPCRRISSSKYLTKSSRKVITVPVHQVVSVPPVLLPQLLQDLLHLLLREVRVPQVDGLFVPKLLPQLGSLSGTNVENPREREWMPTVCIFSSINLQTRVVDAKTHVSRVVVGPEHVVDVEDDRLARHVKNSCFFNLFSLIWGAKWQFTRSIHHFGKTWWQRGS